MPPRPKKPWPFRIEYPPELPISTRADEIIAATSVARRVAEELNVPFGREVGCKIRFADQTSDDTVIKFMTDGMLLADLQADPELRAYDTIIVDEAHERSLNIDFILGHLRRLRVHRPDLKIVITAATIDTAAFSA